MLYVSYYESTEELVKCIPITKIHVNNTVPECIREFYRNILHRLIGSKFKFFLTGSRQFLYGNHVNIDVKTAMNKLNKIEIKVPDYDLFYKCEDDTHAKEIQEFLENIGFIRDTTIDTGEKYEIITGEQEYYSINETFGFTFGLTENVTCAVDIWGIQEDIFNPIIFSCAMYTKVASDQLKGFIRKVHKTKMKLNDKEDSCPVSKHLWEFIHETTFEAAGGKDKLYDRVIIE